MRDMYYFVAYAGDKVASPRTGYSVEAYANYYVGGSDEAMSDLMLHCMYYGDSATRYFATK